MLEDRDEVLRCEVHTCVQQHVPNIAAVLARLQLLERLVQEQQAVVHSNARDQHIRDAFLLELFDLEVITSPDIAKHVDSS